MVWMSAKHTEIEDDKGEASKTYRNKESWGGKGESCKLGGVGAFLSQVFEIGLKRAGEFRSSGFQAESLRDALRRFEVAGG